MKNQSSNKTRSLFWEDEAPEEALSRREQQYAPSQNREPASTPLEIEDPEVEEFPRKGKPRFGAQKKSRWSRTKAVGRALLTLTTVGGMAACAFVFINFLSSDAHFRIQGTDNIYASGLTEVSRADLLPVFGEDIGRNIFFVPLAERRRQLEEIPWVEQATVMRLLPDQIHVSIVERKPVAFVRQGTQIGLVDASGVLLSMPAAMMAQHHYSFPVVTGINAQDTPDSHKARMAVYQRLLAELDSSGQKFSEQISEIDLSDPADARVLMPEQSGDILAHFGEDHFLERYQHYKANINDWLQQYPKLAAVDLRYEQQVVLEMATNDATQAAAGELNAGNGSESQTHSGQVAEKEHVAGKSPRMKATPVKAQKAAAKPAGKGSVKAKPPATKKKSAMTRTAARTAKAKDKKRAEAHRAAQNISKQKTAPNTRPAATAELGQ
ncbi:MAG TPA: FtsQ-type POTRA domain-containing protein [Terracidiphilus sp.]